MADPICYRVVARHKREGSFDSAYRKLVEALRELRDKHNQDPARIAQHAAQTLLREK